jgi:hypothetical protein
MKAALYGQYSTDKQGESSISDQFRIGRERAVREGWNVVGTYEDLGINGGALGNRPGVQRMLAAAFAGEFEVWLVMELSRLSRSQGDLSPMIDQLVYKGIRVIGIHGKRTATIRPRSEWITHEVPDLRIVPQALWNAVKRQQQKGVNPSARLKRGGKKRYLLSGLLECGECKGSFVICNASQYGCGTHRDGGKCRNQHLVTRDALEARILDPVFDRLLAPKAATQLASYMDQQLRQRLAAASARASEAPAEVKALDQRIARLRPRLKAGDEDMTPDELAEVIRRAEEKRAELLTALPGAKRDHKVVRMLPGRVAEVRKAIEAGRKGLDPRTVERARTHLQRLLGGKVRLRPGRAGLTAEFSAGVARVSIGMVAGAGFEPATFGL